MITLLITGECRGENFYDHNWLLFSLLIPEAESDFEDDIISFVFLILLE